MTRAVVLTLLVSGGWLLTSRSALAHDGEPLRPHDLWTSWPWEPVVLVGLVMSALIYWWGLATLWQRAGRGRGVTRHQVLCYGAGLGVMAVALLSPLAVLSDALFSAHMVQHILLMNVAAPLIIWGTQPSLVVWALPRSRRRSLARWWRRRRRLRKAWRALSHPATVWGLYGATLWIWHVPRFYEAAIVSHAVHFWEHVGFLGSALLFWWVLNGSAPRRKFHVGAAVLFLFTTALHSGLLAALITFAPRPLYPIYAESTAAWGLDLLADQQLAGVIMWWPVGFVYLAAVLWRIGQQLRAAENSTIRKGSYGNRTQI